MALSIVDIYSKLLPKTNCKACGYSTCLAFASMVVSEKIPLRSCPHLSPKLIGVYQKELEIQYAAGKWTKKDMSQDALQWARHRSASMKIEDLPARIGGRLHVTGDSTALELPYFNDIIFIQESGIFRKDGQSLNRWEQVFIYNHMAQGGETLPGRNWKAFEQLPNTISKVSSMRSHVEAPLIRRFAGSPGQLEAAGKALGATDAGKEAPGSDVALLFQPLPRIPVLLIFWDHDPADHFDARIKLLFDETITVHLDIESILFLSERLRQLLCGEASP
jgi:hypothetical protein